MSNGLNEYNPMLASDSVQFRAEGTDPNFAYDLFGFSMRIYSDATELPAWGTPARDAFLRKTLYSNSLLSGIVYGEVTRVKNTPYQLLSEDKNIQVGHWQNILINADFGKGFRGLLSKVATDLLVQDNGAFIEILGDGDIKSITRESKNGTTIQFIAKGKRTGEPSGIAYIDAATCWRTYDPEYPVIYTNPYTGEMTILHWTRVIALSQFEQGQELARGLGLCALSRAYEMSRMALAMNTFYYEKITGQSPEIFFTNTPTKNLQDAVTTSSIHNLDKGFAIFKDSVIVSPRSGGVGQSDFSISKLGLRDVPDGFSYRENLDIAVFILANAFGIDAREIWPAVGSGATKADASIQHAKSSGKGRADIMQMIEDAINWRVFPPHITFKFVVVDDIEDQQKAEIAEIRARTRQTQILSGELSVAEARLMAAERGDIDPTFLDEMNIADDTTNQAGVNKEPSIETPEDVALPNTEKLLKKKDYYGTRTAFMGQLMTYCQLGVIRQLNKREFTSRIKSLIQRSGLMAYTDGLRYGAGNLSVIPDAEEMLEVMGLINQQITYLANLKEFIYGKPSPHFQAVIARASLWANKGLDTLFNAGKLAGAKNKMLIWRLGRTEKHCPSCLKASGQVHRAKLWKKYGIIPRAQGLSCNGFQCDCSFEISKERSRGNIQSIPFKGMNKAHAH